MIAQSNQNKEHSHGVTDPGHSHSVGLSDHSESRGTYPYSAAAFYNRTGDTASSKTKISIDLEGGIEARPDNTSIKIWKRTA